MLLRHVYITHHHPTQASPPIAHPTFHSDLKSRFFNISYLIHSLRGRSISLVLNETSINNCIAFFPLTTGLLDMLFDCTEPS